MTEIPLNIVLKADGSGLVGEVRVSSDALKKLGQETKEANAQADRGTRHWERFTRSQKDTGQSLQQTARQVRALHVAMVALATGAVGRVAGSFVAAASEAEGYQTRLNRILGDQAEANRLFREAAEFAGRVPFAYREIMASATQLAGVLEGGADEVMQLLPLIADLAAVSGLSIGETSDQIIRMFSAGAASADLFRERGILAMLGFQAGVTYSAEETRKRLIAAWEDPQSKFRDAAQDLADDWTGILSMMGDKWFQFRNQVMDAGPFEDIKAIFGGINSAYDENADAMQERARLLGEAISREMRRTALDIARTIDGINRLLELPDRFERFVDRNIRSHMAEVENRRGRGKTVPLFPTPDGGVAPRDQAEQLWAEYYEGGVGPAEQAMLDAFRRSDERQTDRAMGGLLAGAPPRKRGGGNGSGLSKKELQELEDRIRVDDEIMGGLLGGEMPADGGMTAKIREDHRKTAEDIRDAWQEILPEYERAVAAADTWRRETLAGLDETSGEYDALAGKVEDVYRRRIKDAYEQSLRDSRRWEDGVKRGFQSYAKAALDAGAAAERGITSSLSSMEDALVDFVTTGKMEFGSLVNSMIADIARLVIQQRVTGPIASFLGDLDFGSLFGGGSAGGGGSSNMVRANHAGGIVGRDGTPRYAPEHLFAGAPRFHNGGLIGPGEVPIIAKAGEEVLTEDDPRHRNNRGGQEIVLRIIDGEGREVPNRQSRGSNGQLNVEMMIDQMVGRLGRRRGTETRRMIEDLGGGAGLRSV